MLFSCRLLTLFGAVMLGCLLLLTGEVDAQLRQCLRPENTSIIAHPTEGNALGVADINNDGFMDLITADEGFGRLDIFIAHNGYFLGPHRTARIGAGNSRSPDSISSGDFSGDGYHDLVVVNYTHDVNFLTNRYPITGHFTSFSLAGSSYDDGNFGGAELHDLNGDGQLDVVAVEPQGVGVFINKQGIFGPAQHYILPSLICGTYEMTYSIAVGKFLDDDTHLDVASSCYTSSGFKINLMPGIGNGAFDTTRAITIEGPNSQLVTTSDIDGNGLDDLLMSVRPSNNSNYQIRILANQGSNVFSELPPLEIPFVTSVPTDIDVADLDGNQLPDVVVAVNDENGGPSPFGYRNLDGNRFSRAVYLGLGTSPLTNAKTLALADFYGDGSIDIAALVMNKTLFTIKNLPECAP